MIKFIGKKEDLVRHGFVIKEFSAVKPLGEGKSIFVNIGGEMFPLGYMSDNKANKSFDILPIIWEMIAEGLVIEDDTH